MAERSLTQQVFGRSIKSLEYADVARFFKKERSESIRLEFKSYVDDKNKGPKTHIQEVYQSICGMLNSEGGVIIWGAPVGEPSPGRNEKVFTGPLTSVGYDREDDQFTSGILDNLDPMPPSIAFKKLSKGKSIIYVVEVPRSPYAPHQFKGTYYARFGAQNRVAPHYLVQALMRSTSYPNVMSSTQFVSSERKSIGYMTLCEVTIRNESPYQNEENVVVTVQISEGRWNQAYYPHGSVRIERDRAIFDNAVPVLHFGVERRHKFHFYNSSIGTEVLVGIGGKHSPAKYSKYVLGEGGLRPVFENVSAADMKEEEL